MTSLFSFMRSGAGTANPQPAQPNAPPPAAPVPLAPVASTALAAPAAPAMNSAPADYLADMLMALRAFLTPAGAPLPDPTVSLVSVIERPVGLGGLRGIEPFGGFSAVALKGGRFDAVVRFQLWGNDPGEVEDAANTLYGALLAAQATLWQQGFLKMMPDASAQAEFVANLNAWRKSVDYRVLYEYRYQESDAESLIAQIPISISELFAESTLITDDMVRWDNVAAPVLSVRLGRRQTFQLRELAILSFLPAGWDGVGVTLSATVGGATVQQSFASVRAFQASFAMESETIQLGAHSYSGGRRLFPNADFPNPILLEGGEDVVQITYAAAAFDSDAVVYLRVLS